MISIDNVFVLHRLLGRYIRVCMHKNHLECDSNYIYIYTYISIYITYSNVHLSFCVPRFRSVLLQFDAVENGIAITKLMQIFSRQAPMMDALLSYFAEQMRRRREGYDGQPPEYVGPEGELKAFEGWLRYDGESEWNSCMFCVRNIYIYCIYH